MYLIYSTNKASIHQTSCLSGCKQKAIIQNRNTNPWRGHRAHSRCRGSYDKAVNSLHASPDDGAAVTDCKYTTYMPGHSFHAHCRHASSVFLCGMIEISSCSFSTQILCDMQTIMRLKKMNPCTSLHSWYNRHQRTVTWKQMLPVGMKNRHNQEKWWMIG